MFLIKTSAGNEGQNPLNTLKHKGLFALSLIIYSTTELRFPSWVCYIYSTQC